MSSDTQYVSDVFYFNWSSTGNFNRLFVELKVSKFLFVCVILIWSTKL